MSTVNNPFSLLPVHNRQQKTKGHKSDNISEHIDKKVGKAYGIPISKISSYFRKQMQIYAVTCITGCAAILFTEKEKIHKQNHIADKAHGQHITDELFQFFHSYCLSDTPKDSSFFKILSITVVTSLSSSVRSLARKRMEYARDFSSAATFSPS